MPLPTVLEAYHAIGIPGLVVKGPDGTLWPFPLTRNQQEEWIDFEEGRRAVCSICHQAVALAQAALPLGCYAVPGCTVAEAERVKRHGS